MAGLLGRQPRWLRATAIGGVIAVVVAFAAVVAYRVLAPAEVVSPARGAYPPPPDAVVPGVIGSFSSAPLIVAGRLRVYASQREVQADGPVDARTQRTPYWSYRRWPAQLLGVVAAGPTVVTQWSDGVLVAIHARDGTVAWRADGPRAGAGYTGRRTGARTVYAPAHLFVAGGGTAPASGGAGGTVLVSGGTEVRGYDAVTGRVLWRQGDRPAGAACANGEFTTRTWYVLFTGCDRVPTVSVLDVATGRWLSHTELSGPAGQWRVRPRACAVGRTDCRAVRTRAPDGRTRGWLLGPPDAPPGPVSAGPVRLPLLDPPTAWLVGGAVIDATVPDGGPVTGPSTRTAALVARSVATGETLWRWRAPTDQPRDRVRIIAAQADRVHLLSGDTTLITLQAATGGQLSRFQFRYVAREPDWTPGLVYAADGFLAVERLAIGATPADPDSAYYAFEQPVLFAAT